MDLHESDCGADVPEAPWSACGQYSPYNSPMNIDRELAEFQSIMLDLLVRSKIFRAEECLLIDKHPDQLIIQAIAHGYLLTQVADLRKFFDPNRRNQSYDLAAIVALTSDPKIQARYNELRANWEQEYRDLADRVFFHRDRSYSPPLGTDRHSIERFIDSLNEFLDHLVSSLNEGGHAVSHLDRNPNGSFLMDVESDAIATFRMMT